MSESYHVIADRALGQGNFAAAVVALERGLPSAPDDFDGWLKLAALRRRIATPTAALEAVHRALSVRPNEYVALLLKGALHEQLGEPGRAAEVYRAAVFHAAATSTRHPAVVQQIEHARRFLASYRRDVEARIGSFYSLDPTHRARARTFLDNVFDRPKQYRQEPTHYRYPGLPDIAFFDFAYDRLRARLRAAFPAIRAEFLNLVNQHADRQHPYVAFIEGQPVGQWVALNHSSDWTALHLLRHDERDEINAAACPATLAAFAGEEQADIPGLSPNLMFSLLKPHTHIPPHHGVANFRAVLHLPLIVPPGCRFRVGGDTREWIEGEPWIFDDTIEHEAWNDSDSLRVVLIGDLWHPELDAVDRGVVRETIAAQGSADIIDGL